MKRKSKAVAEEFPNVTKWDIKKPTATSRLNICYIHMSVPGTRMTDCRFFSAADIEWIRQDGVLMYPRISLPNL